jgi:hypothetical protein
LNDNREFDISNHISKASLKLVFNPPYHHFWQARTTTRVSVLIFVALNGGWSTFRFVISGVLHLRAV